MSQQESEEESDTKVLDVKQENEKNDGLLSITPTDGSRKSSRATLERNTSAKPGGSSLVSTQEGTQVAENVF